jgi:hypothetical protein
MSARKLLPVGFLASTPKGKEQEFEILDDRVFFRKGD